jgi:hypothetical protein
MRQKSAGLLGVLYDAVGSDIQSDCINPCVVFNVCPDIPVAINDPGILYRDFLYARVHGLAFCINNGLQVLSILYLWHCEVLLLLLFFHTTVVRMKWLLEGIMRTQFYRTKRLGVNNSAGFR